MGNLKALKQTKRGVKKMLKKILITIFSLSLLVWVAGCSNQTTKSEDNTAKTEAKENNSKTAC